MGRHAGQEKQIPQHKSRINKETVGIAINKIYRFFQDDKEVTTVYIFGNGSIRWIGQGTDFIRGWLNKQEFSKLKEKRFHESSQAHWKSLPIILNGNEDNIRVEVEPLYEECEEKPLKMYGI